MTTEPAKTDRPTWLPEAEFPFTSRYIKIDGHRIHYVDEGAGPVLLFLTGGVTWSFIFRDVITRLRNKFRTIALDLPGAGLSTSLAGYEQTLEGQSRIVEGFVDALHLEQITLVAHDLGGPIGLGVYARRSGRFAALAATSTFGFPLQSHPDIVKELRRFSGPLTTALNGRLNLVARVTSTRMGVGRHLTRAGKRAYLGPFSDRRVRDDGMALLRSAIGAGAYLESVERALRAAPADLPVLLLYGEKDPGRMAGFQEHFETIFPQARSRVVAGAHHFPHTDDPEQVAATLESWWTEVVAQAYRPA
jgi:haloalkane dehalogenase